MLVRLAALTTAVAICLAPGAARASGAQPLHASSRFRVPGFGSVEIRKVLSASHDLEFRKVLAVDLDRDGDLDVLASTNRGVLLWLNDGHGHLVIQEAAPSTALASSPASNGWHDRQQLSMESVQPDPPSLDSSAARAHAPPVPPVARPPFRDFDRPASSASTLFATRAPPL